MNYESTKSGHCKVAIPLEHDYKQCQYVYCDFRSVLIQILNVTLYNVRSIPLSTLFFLILILNITDVILQNSLLNKPAPRMLEVLDMSLFLVIKSSLGKLTLI